MSMLEDMFIGECMITLEDILNREYTNEEKEYLFGAAFDNNATIKVPIGEDASSWDRWQGAISICQILDDFDDKFGYDFYESFPLEMDFEELLEKCPDDLYLFFNDYLELREKWLKSRSN